jgi:hypothetical protein
MTCVGAGVFVGFGVFAGVLVGVNVFVGLTVRVGVLVGVGVGVGVPQLVVATPPKLTIPLLGSCGLYVIVVPTAVLVIKFPQQSV